MQNARARGSTNGYVPRGFMQKSASDPPPSGSGQKTPRAVARRFWQEGIALGALVGLTALTIGLLLPTEYQSESVVRVLPGDKTRGLPPDLDQSVHGLATANAVLKSLADRVQGEESIAKALEVVTPRVSVTPTGPGEFRITYRAEEADAARQGCEDLTHAITRGAPALAKDYAANKTREDELDAKTRDLALFVAAHPYLVAESLGAAPAGEKTPADKAAETHPTAPSVDPTLLVLREEKRRIEGELASHAAPAPSPSSVFGPNPYDDPQESAAVENLQRRLGELRLAIGAHQRAVASKDTPAPGKPVVTPAADPALVAEWHRLVQSVVDAQAATRSGAVLPLVATVVEAPSLPTSPARPSRAIIGLVSALAAMWSAVTWALLRARGLASKGKRRAVMAPMAPVTAPAPAGFTRPAWVTSTLKVTPEQAAALAAQEATTAVAKRDGREPPVTPAAPEPLLAPQRTVDASRSQSTEAFAATVAVSVQEPGVPTRESDRPTRPVSEPPRPRSSNPPPLPPNDPSRRISSNPPPRAVTKSDPPRPVTKSDPPRAVMKSDPPRAVMKSDPPRPRAKSDPPRPSLKSDPPRPRQKSDPPRPTAKPEGPRPDAARLESVRETLRPPQPSPSTAPPPGPWPTNEELNRPSQPPRERRTLSPPPVEAIAPAEGRDEAPDTRRIGSREPPSRHGVTQVHGTQPGAKLDTTYSIVDRSRRPSSRKPEPRPAEELRLSSRATRRLSTDLEVLQAGLDPPGVTGYEGRPPPEARGRTRPGFANLSPPPVAANAEIVRVQSSPPASVGDVVRPRPVPPSWRPPPPSANGDEVRELCDQLLHQKNGACFVLGVVSDVGAIETKTALAVRLALLLAESGRRVLALEANFDYPALTRVLGIDMPSLAGFSQQVHSRMRSGDRMPWTVVRCTQYLHVLGESFMRSPGVALSREFSDAISELRRGYDFIIADGPTASASADCKPLNAFADGLVVAVNRGDKLADAIERATRWFTRKDLMAAVHFDAR